MKAKVWFFCIVAMLSGGLFPLTANALFQLSMSSAWVTPTTLPGGDPTYNVWAYVQIVGVDFDDPTPNPCYQRTGCKLRFAFLGAYTDDPGWPATYDDSQYPTLGNFASTTANRNAMYRRAKVGYTVPYGEKVPTNAGCVFIVPTINRGWWGANEPINGLPAVSPCTYTYMPASDCKLNPNTLEVSFGTVAPEEVSTREVITPYTLQCTPGVERYVTISTGGLERVVMNGSGRIYAELDWGAGYGKALRTPLKDNVALKLKTRLVGFTSSDVGDFTGSTVVQIAYM
ncbi:hypothetical protein [Pantoea coffeiphila]|nr:hypothetical protein [Pantoea coffeiphila]